MANMKKYNLLISTRLKTKDPSSATVKTVLRSDMGYGGKVLDVGREELWVVEAFAGNSESADELCERIALNTWIFYNPNKHTLSLDVKEDGSPLIGGMKHTPPVYEVIVAVRFREDEKELSSLRFLKQACDEQEVISAVRKFILWHLKIRSDSKSEAVSIAETIAEAKSIDSGLLANPSSQRFEVIA